ncbi:hypothetical protein [Campylobacter sp. JMF_03 NE3]|uniref:hypothetical protein n=1 Tax=Campylobacter sp. JMF_03 NE3 TaxID=2983831 RepID=UPI0022E9BC28|nr:hypothetical protein [Campylobacter sp. JMF_03 NE3]MDA3053681.1 hypothetical protein [Campylobacter sp. JMF_03 NE3]
MAISKNQFAIKYIPASFLIKIQDYIDWEDLFEYNFQNRTISPLELLKLKPENASLELIGKTFGLTPYFFTTYCNFNYDDFVRSDKTIKINGTYISDPDEKYLYVFNIKSFVNDIDWESFARYGKFESEAQLNRFLEFISANYSNNTSQSLYFFSSDRNKELRRILANENFKTDANIIKNNIFLKSSRADDNR